MKRLAALSAAVILATVGDWLHVAAQRLAVSVFGEDAAFVEGGAVCIQTDCERCEGKGFHHGFGEYGVDPDLCGDCGGPGIDWKDVRDVGLQSALKLCTGEEAGR